MQTIGEVSIGQAFTVAGDGPVRACSVTGFEAVLEGQPHFSYIDSESELSRPMCGEMVAHAVLDCDSSIGAALVVGGGVAAPDLHVLPPLALGTQFLRSAKRYTLQFVIIKPIFALF